MNTINKSYKVKDSVLAMYIPGGWSRGEADHRFLKPAVPMTIGDQQAAMALLVFFDRIDQVERRSSRSLRSFGFIAQLGALVWFEHMIRWIGQWAA